MLHGHQDLECNNRSTSNIEHGVYILKESMLCPHPAPGVLAPTQRFFCITLPS